MKFFKKILLIWFCVLLLFALIPSRTENIHRIYYEQGKNIQISADPFYTDSFNLTDGDYFFLKCVQNINYSAITGFSPPNLTEHWMIEVTTLTAGPPTDNLTGNVFDENISSALDRWIPSTIFPNEITFGSYNNTIYTIDSSFLNQFPVPFIVPINITAVNNTLQQALSINLSGNFQHCVFANGTALWESWKSAPGGNMLDMIPFALHSIVIAYNGTSPIQLTNDTLPILANGTADGDLLLEAVYFDDGILNFIRESEWNASSQKWNARYKLVSPICELLGSMIEMVLPGSDLSGGGEPMIPGFPCAFVVLGLMATIALVYLRKPKNEIII